MKLKIQYLILLPILFLSSGYVSANEKFDVWPLLKKQYFGDKVLHDDGDKFLTLEAPKRAEDASVVPINLKAKQPQTDKKYIKNLYLIIENNPDPYAAKFEFSNSLKTIDIGTRIRINTYTNLRAVVEMNDGSMHMLTKFVKASGGCSAPAVKNPKEAEARLGKMQIRMRESVIGKPVKTQVIISHPNSTGLQMELNTGGYIPAHYVTHVNIDYNGKSLMKIKTGISISEDPSFRFVFTPKQHGVLTVDAKDNKGMTFKKQKKL